MKNLLLVEDEAITGITQTKILKKEGYDVIHVLSGEEAIALCREKKEAIDLILMDVDLGNGIDGTQAAQEILKEKDIPILFLSSHTEKEIVEKTERITSYGYVVKNTGITVLAASIKMAFRLHSAKRDLNQRDAALQRLNRSLTCISQCNEAVIRAADERTLLFNICAIVCDKAGYRMAWVGYAENDENKTIRPVAWAGVENGYIEDARLSWSDATERGRGPAGLAVRSGETILSQDFETDAIMIPWRTSALERGYRSGIAIPLKDENGTAFGVLMMYAPEPNFISPDELQLMEEMTGDLAFGIMTIRTRAERARAEKRVMRERENFYKILTTAPIGLLIINRDTVITNVNDTLGSLVFRDPSQIIGRRAGSGLGCLHSFEDPRGCGFSQACRSCPLRSGLEKAVVGGIGVHDREINLTLLVNGKPQERWINVNIEPVDIEDSQYAIVAVDDITDRKMMEQALRRSEAELREAQRVGRLGSWDWDSTADTITWSEEYYRIYGFDPSQSPPGYIEHLNAYTPESAKRLDEAVKRNMETGEHYVIDLELASPAGPTRWISARSETKRDATGRIIGLRGTAQDITEHKKAEEALRKSEELFFSVFRLSPIPIAIYRPADGHIVDVNDAFLVLTGRTREEVVEHTTDELNLYADPDDRVRIRQKLLENESLENFEFGIRGKSGETHIVLNSARLIELHGVRHYLSMLIDITERIRAEEALKTSQHRLRHHLRETPMGIMELDPGFRITYWNPAAERIFGYSAAEAVGKHADLIVPAAAREHVDAVWKDLLALKGGRRSTNENITKDGRVILCDWYNTTLTSFSGEVIGVASMVRGISEGSGEHEK